MIRSIVRTTLIAAVLIGTASTAHATRYFFNTTPDRPLAQVQREQGGPTLCATWRGEKECAVVSGRTYRLITYDANWKNGQTSFFSVTSTGCR